MTAKPITIHMFSIHGLLRADNLELGRDADTGGQILYVLELARHMSTLKTVRRVNLFTRLISDKTVSTSYAEPIEEVTDKFRIVRIKCGSKRYIRKELLWPHLEEFIDKTIKFIKRQNEKPDIVHGHYADAGYVAMRLAKTFGIPFVFTGHSLGRAKYERLLASGMTDEEMIRQFKIDHRIKVEEEIIKHADLIITSTNDEIERQYGRYDGKEVPRFNVIPPGCDLDKFFPIYRDEERTDLHRHAYASLKDELNRFFIQPDKPIILSLCRPDKRKNISGLIRAFGEDRDLQAMANLAVFAGIRKDISMMEENEKGVLTEILLLMDKFDLYGKIAIPKQHDFDYEVPELYRIAAESRGVFVNSALTEPFGLTIIEASACGLPVVVPDDGGPRDILANLKNGILVDTTSPEVISRAIKAIITDSQQWKTYSKNGIIYGQKIYTWKAHVKTYEAEIKNILKPEAKRRVKKPAEARPIGERLTEVDYLFVTDIDNTLTGGKDKDLRSLLAFLEQNRNRFAFAVATGRTIQSTIEHLGELDIPRPDVCITSVGSEIYYGKKLSYDRGWDAHLTARWNRERIEKVLNSLDFLELQEEETQRKFKISYLMEPSENNLVEVHRVLTQNKLRYTLVYSHQAFLDILPYRDSKGKAIRYLSYKWEIPLQSVIVCGDSGNDEEMLRGESAGIVVGNYSEELESLRGHKRIYFARETHAAGILEGLRHYNFLNDLGEKQ